MISAAPPPIHSQHQLVCRVCEIKRAARVAVEKVADVTKNPERARKSARLVRCRVLNKTEGACLFSIRVTTDHTSVCVGVVYVRPKTGDYKFAQVKCLPVRSS